MITELTPEQEVLLEQWKKEWFKIGSCCDPADRPTAETAITAMYAKLSKPKPTFVWVDSPQAAKKLIKSEEGEYSNTYLWGQMEAHWISFYLFMEEIGIEYKPEDRELLGFWADICKSCGWWWVFDETCYVCERPLSITWDEDAPGENPVIGNRTGPSVEFRDGWKIWAVEGILVPEDIITHPELLTVERINQESNEEIRRIMRGQYGDARFLKDSGAKVLDWDMEGCDKGAAPRALIEDNNGERWMLGTDGGTGRNYVMSVHKDSKNCVEAHQSRCGFDESKIVNKS